MRITVNRYTSAYLAAALFLACAEVPEDGDPTVQGNDETVGCAVGESQCKSARAGAQAITLRTGAGGNGFEIVGSGFAPAGWIWLVIYDDTAGVQILNGPDPFLPSATGTFQRSGATALPCGHVLVAYAYVADEIVAESSPLTPPCGAQPVPSTDPADPALTAASRAALESLQRATSRSDHRLVVGQALRSWDFKAPVDQPITALTVNGLPAPKLIEMDLHDWGYDAGHDAALDAVARAHVQAGGWVGFTHHPNNPFVPGEGAWIEKEEHRSLVKLSELSDPANPQTPAAVAWRAELDRIAVVLASLQAQNAVVLFRPLHEANARWFWWGGATPDEFRALWRGYVSYLTAHKGIHNVIWVYAAARDYGGISAVPYYPGADAVDVVGIDLYDNDMRDGVTGYAGLTALGKPFAITEYGATLGPNGEVDAHDGALELPNGEVIAKIRTDYPAAVLATAWFSQFGPADRWNNFQISDRPNPSALLRDPWAITR